MEEEVRPVHAHAQQQRNERVAMGECVLAERHGGGCSVGMVQVGSCLLAGPRCWSSSIVRCCLPAQKSGCGSLEAPRLDT